MLAPSVDLATYGWDPAWQATFGEHAGAGFVPGRVVSQAREQVDAITATGPVAAIMQRGFRRAAVAAGDYPTVGDWLTLEPFADGSGAAVRAVLPRRSAFARGRSDGSGQVGRQVVAANVDTVFIVVALTRDYNLRRAERYLALAWSSGAHPVVILNKADLADDAAGRREEVAALAAGADVHVLSALTGVGLEALAPYLVAARTVCLLGSSGVGKSTITNALLGEGRQRVRDVREDDHRGRHTTTGRELFVLPGGGLLIDTPGMRSIGLWESDDGLETTFADIDALAPSCRFRDCSHRAEPGCAVIAAIEAGDLDPERLSSQRKLERELRAQERRASPPAARLATRRFARAIRTVNKEKHRMQRWEYP